MGNRFITEEYEKVTKNWGTVRVSAPLIFLITLIIDFCQSTMGDQFVGVYAGLRKKKNTQTT